MKQYITHTIIVNGIILLIKVYCATLAFWALNKFNSNGWICVFFSISSKHYYTDLLSNVDVSSSSLIKIRPSYSSEHHDIRTYQRGSQVDLYIKWNGRGKTRANFPFRLAFVYFSHNYRIYSVLHIFIAEKKNTNPYDRYFCIQLLIVIRNHIIIIHHTTLWLPIHTDTIVEQFQSYARRCVGSIFSFLAFSYIFPSLLSVDRRWSSSTNLKIAISNTR